MISGADQIFCSLSVQEFRHNVEMSVVEPKRAVDELSADDRLEVAEHIRHSFRVGDSARQAEIERTAN